MPATFTPISNDVLAGVRQGDERALERLFREHYDALIDEAKANLDDPVTAPRVVETAMLRTWEQHTGFETAATLEAFLHSAVHEGAIREKARRAGVHRLESHEAVRHVSRAHQTAPATVDDAWAHITSALHASPPNAAHLAELATASRHAAATHMAAVAKRRSPLITIAYVGATLATVAALMYALFRESPDALVTRMLKSGDAHEIISKFGQIGTVTLDDGSKVKIGADSRLLIPPGFATKVRAVRVAGTGSFDVATRTGLPFEVRLGDVAVIATGTRFAVNYDTATRAALVRVDEGSVTVRSGTVVKPLAVGEAMEVDGKGEMRTPNKAAIDEALAWTSNRLVIVDRPLRSALEQTRRWYAIALMPSDMSLMDRQVSVDAPLDSSTKMIADLERTGKLKFGWNDKSMVLFDASASRAPTKKK